MGLLERLIRLLLPRRVLDGLKTALRERQIQLIRRRRERSRSICLLPTDGVLPPRKVRNPWTGEMMESSPGEGLKGLAKGLGLNPRRLSRLLYTDKSLYTAFTRPKASGGERTIHAPVGALKFVQRRIVDRILDWIDLGDCVHGFRRGCSVVTGAVEHVGKQMVLRMDIEDFFPSIHFGRVLGLFRSLQFSPKHAFILAKLTTVDGVLPQGAPTSPGIANAVCRKLDRRLAGAAHMCGVSYTRYADDLTFSGPADEVKRMIPFVRKVVEEEGFKVSRKKVRLMGAGRRQVVTGVVVNQKLNVPRYYRRWLRAVIHHLRTKGVTSDGLTAQQAAASLRGHAQYIKMVNVEHGERLLLKLEAVLKEP